MNDKISLSNLQPQQVQATPEVATEAVPLPSKGVIYPEGTSLCDATHIDIKPMTAKEEDILTSRALMQNGRAIDALLRSCLFDRSIDPTKMLTGDRNAAIIGIRITGYGSDYSTIITCPACASKTEMEMDLSSLPIKGIPEDVKPVASHVNEFALTLPSGKVATFKLPTGTDDAEMSAYIERLRKTTGMDNIVTTRLMQQIISYDGETDRQKLSDKIRNMPAKDSRELRSYMDYANPDVKWVSQYSCSTCGYEAEEVEVPLGTEFFWPKARR